jgi:hypothetical protein
VSERDDKGPKQAAEPATSRAITPRDPPLARTKTPTGPPGVHPIGTPRGLSSNAGILAVGAWLVARGLYPPAGPWRIEISLEATSQPGASSQPRSFYTRFEITIASDAWGYRFCHGDRTSTVRVTDIAQARDRDEHRLAMATPPLKQLGKLLRDLEQRYHVFFGRHHATIRTDLSGSEPMIRAWLASL